MRLRINFYDFLYLNSDNDANGNGIPDDQEAGAISANNDTGSGYDIADHIFGSDVAHDYAATHHDEAAHIADNLAKFQADSGWTPDQMKDYVANHSDWASKLDTYVAGHYPSAAPADPAHTDTPPATHAGEAAPAATPPADPGANSSAANTFHAYSPAADVTPNSNHSADSSPSYNFGSATDSQSVQNGFVQGAIGDLGSQAVPAADDPNNMGMALVENIYGTDVVSQFVTNNPTEANHILDNLNHAGIQSAADIDHIKSYLSAHQDVTIDQAADYMATHKDSWRDLVNGEQSPAATQSQPQQFDIAGMAADATGTTSGPVLAGVSTGIAAAAAGALGATHTEPVGPVISAADQQRIDTLLASNHQWNQVDVNAYIEANSKTWQRDLGQMLAATSATQDSHLGAEAVSLVREVMVAHPDMSASDAQAMVRVMANNPDMKVGDIKDFIAANPEDWKSTMYQADKADQIAQTAHLNKDDSQQIQSLMMSHKDMTEDDAAKMVTLLKANPDLKTDEVNQYISTHADWKKDLNQFATAEQVLAGTAAKDLTVAEKNLVKGVMVDHSDMTQQQADALVRVISANPQMKVEDISAYIKANPDTWTTTLNRVDTASSLAKTNHMDAEASDQLNRYLINNPTVTAEQVNDYVKNNPKTWSADLEAFDVAHAKGLNPADTQKLVQLSRSENALGEIDLAKFMSQPDWKQRLAQVDLSAELANKYKMTETEANQLQRVLAENPNFTAKTVDDYINNHKDTWKKDLGNFDLGFDKLGLDGKATDALVRLTQKDPSNWSEAKINDLKAAHPGDWQEVLQLEDFSKTNNLTAAQKAQLTNVMTANPDFTIKDVEDYVSARPTAWKQDLARMDLAVKVADHLGLNDEQKTQLRGVLVNHADLTQSQIENMFKNDRAQFDRTLDQMDLGDKLHLSSSQNAALGKVLEAHPEWKEKDIQQYVAAHASTWKGDLIQAGAASDLSLKYHLSNEQESLLTNLMIANPKLSSTELEAKLKDHPTDFTALLESVKSGNQIADSHSFSEAQRAQLTRIMSENPALTSDVVNNYIANNKSWATTLKQMDGAYSVAMALHLSDQERDIVQQMMVLDPKSTATGVASYIGTHKDTWSTDLQQMALITTNKMTQAQGDQLKAIMTDMPTWTADKVQAYITAHPDSWQKDLKTAYTTDAIANIATQNHLTPSDQNLAAEWLMSNQRMTPAQVSALIKDHPTDWQQALAQVGSANQIAEAHQFKPEEKEALVRIMAADPNMKPAVVEKFIADHKDNWSTYLNRFDGALAINETLNLSSSDRALVQAAMTSDPQLTLANTVKLINEHPQDWQAQLTTKINDVNATIAANQTSGGPGGTPRLKEWVPEVSFEDYKKSIDPNDKSKWVDHQVMVTPPTEVWAGLDQTYTQPAVYETRKGPMTDEDLQAQYLKQFGSPIEKLTGHPSGEFVRTYIPFSGNKDEINAPVSEKVVLDKTPLPLSETTGDTRNKSINHTGDFINQMEAFQYKINGVSYKDLDKSLVPYLDTSTYLARQLTDNAKAMKFSYENKAGDTAAQLGVYLDNLGVKNVNALFVENGRIVDKSNNHDLGAYDPKKVFADTAYGDGWTDFYAQTRPNGQLVIVPKWGDSSDAGAIKMIAAVAGAFVGIPPVWTNAAIDLASGHGLNLKGMATSLVASYVGGQVSAGLSGGESIFGSAGNAIIDTGSQIVDKALIGGFSNAAGSLVTGGDPLKAFVSGAVNSAASSAGNWAVGNINSALDLGLSQSVIAGAGNFLGTMATSDGNWQKALVTGIRTGVEVSNRIDRQGQASPGGGSVDLPILTGYFDFGAPSLFGDSTGAVTLPFGLESSGPPLFPSIDLFGNSTGGVPVKTGTGG